MKKLLILGSVFFCMTTVQMAHAEDAAEGKFVGEQTTDIRLHDMERTVAGLEREISRLEDRYDSLKHDMDEIKRKV